MKYVIDKTLSYLCDRPISAGGSSSQNSESLEAVRQLTSKLLGKFVPLTLGNSHRVLKSYEVLSPAESELGPAFALHDRSKLKV